VNDALLAKAKPEAVVLHWVCRLGGAKRSPKEVIEGPHSIVLIGGNRLHIQKAILDETHEK